jgi:hypothetical protein
MPALRHILAASSALGLLAIPVWMFSKAIISPNTATRASWRRTAPTTTCCQNVVTMLSEGLVEALTTTATLLTAASGGRRSKSYPLSPLLRGPAW